MEGLIVKDIQFNGSILRAAQDADKIIWVGVRWICEGLGLSEGQMKKEQRRIHSDLVLSKGGSNLILPTDGGKQNILCLKLDFLPLWLAKIHITPTIKKENPHLAERLVQYQLKAKDVLAAAFLNKEALATMENMVPLEDFKRLERKLDKMYSDMSKLANIILDMKESKGEQAIPTKKDAITNNVTNHWKEDMYAKMDCIYPYADNFNGRADIMKWIYRYMNCKYGIVWEQETKEFTERTGIRRPSTICVVEAKPMLKSIFESVLKDLEYQYAKLNGSWIEASIAMLIKKYNDHSNAGMATYRKVYKKMDEEYNIGWKNLTTRYINQYGKIPSRKELIETRPSLRGKFLSTIKELMEE